MRSYLGTSGRKMLNRYAKKSRERDDGEWKTYLVVGDHRVRVDVDESEFSTEELKERARTLQDMYDRIDNFRELYSTDTFLPWIMVMFALPVLFWAQAQREIGVVFWAIVGMMAFLVAPFIWWEYRAWRYNRLALTALMESSSALLELHQRLDTDDPEEVRDSL